MAHAVATWALAVALLAAGGVNLAGTAASRRDFARWGFPSWWGRVTGLLEIIAAGLVVVPGTHAIGMAITVAVIAAAALTVLWHRDYGHLLPLGVFTALLAAAMALR